MQLGVGRVSAGAVFFRWPLILVGPKLKATSARKVK
jgi:hypothetical protein